MFSVDLVRSGLMAGILAVFASTSHAAPVTIDFAVDRGWTSGTNNYTSDDGSVTVGVDGVRVDRDGAVINTEDFYTASWDSWSGNYGGIGVYNCLNTRRGYCTRDDHRIDGAGPDEFALINFGNLVVEVISATFTYWDRRDTFAFGVYDTTDIPASASIYQENLDDGNSNPYTHFFDDDQVVGSIIGFGADSWRDDFKLQSVTFEVISAVPLPAGIILLLTAIGGLGVIQRRRVAA